VKWVIYENLQALAPYDELDVLLSEDSLEDVDRWAHEGLEGIGRDVEEGGDDGVLKLDRSFIFGGSGILAEVDDVSMACWAI
jgi:hypothetical protein